MRLRHHPNPRGLGNWRDQIDNAVQIADGNISLVKQPCNAISYWIWTQYFSGYLVNISAETIEFYNIFESCITFRLTSRDEHEQNRSVRPWWKSVWNFRWSILQESAFMARRCACPASGSLLGGPWILSWLGYSVQFCICNYDMYVEVTLLSNSYLFSWFLIWS